MSKKRNEVSKWYNDPERQYHFSWKSVIAISSIFAMLGLMAGYFLF